MQQSTLERPIIVLLCFGRTSTRLEHEVVHHAVTVRHSELR